MEPAACPTCGSRVTTTEIEEKKMRDFESYINMLRTTSYRYGKAWLDVRCSEEGMWMNLGKAVLGTLPEEERKPFINWVHGNPSIAQIYTDGADQAIDLWKKRRAKKNAS